MRPLHLLLALGLLAACAPAQAWARVLQEAQPDGPDVIIIGAGMAGITAARNLTDAGFRVLVLEGRERPGGRLDRRLFSYPGGQHFVDLGAMWIHEAVPGANALYDRVTSFGLPVSPRQDYSSMATYNFTTGDRLSRAAYAKVFSAIATQLRPRIAAMKSTPGTPDRALSEVYSEWLAGNSQITASDVGLANIIQHTNYQALLNANFTQLSTLRLGDAKSIPAIDVMLAQGFPAVIDALLEAGDPIDIQYNTTAASIQAGADDVTVTTAEGEAFTAPYFILTAPLGLLKDGDIEIEPPLPDAKLQAIEDMGYGLLDKAIFVFDRPFWDVSSDFLLREMPDWSGRWSVFLNYWKLFKVPALVAIHVADTARELERLTDEQVREEGMAALRRIYQRNGTTVPDPTEFHFTRWAADPWARGSYSFFAVGNQKNVTAALAEPVGRLLFAGEATSNKPASVLGAYLSGIREAQRVTALLNTQPASAAASA